mmetsp:Transcript_25401/g.52544  ORF Transcript_25401/g.52544 Transcript_25401/m.52544 type:complete len:257 (+) Transcript_25401:873-1643(+)
MKVFQSIRHTIRRLQPLVKMLPQSSLRKLNLPRRRSHPIDRPTFILPFLDPIGKRPHQSIQNDEIAFVVLLLLSRTFSTVNITRARTGTELKCLGETSLGSPVQLNNVGMVEARQQRRFVGEILGPDDEFAGVGAHRGTEAFQRQHVGVANRRCRVGRVARDGIRISRGDHGVAPDGGAIAVGLRSRGNLGNAASLSQIEYGAEVIGACEGQCLHLTLGGIFLMTVFGVARTTLGVISSLEIETAAPLSSLGTHSV